MQTRRLQVTSICTCISSGGTFRLACVDPVMARKDEMWVLRLAEPSHKHLKAPELVQAALRSYSVWSCLPSNLPLTAYKKNRWGKSTDTLCLMHLAAWYTPQGLFWRKEALDITSLFWPRQKAQKDLDWASRELFGIAVRKVMQHLI